MGSAQSWNFPHFIWNVRIDLLDIWSVNCGMNVFIMNYNSSDFQSRISFVNLTLDGNRGRASAAIRLDTALNMSSPVNLKPEFIDCTIKNHGANYRTYTAPFTSQRVDVVFKGRNAFTQNHGAGAVEYHAGVIHVEGSLNFIGNSGSQGGAVFLRSSQITLYPGSELRFEKNFANANGGAILVWTREMYEFIRPGNPDCFVVYSKDRTPPSQWKVCFFAAALKKSYTRNKKVRRFPTVSKQDFLRA